MLGNVCSFEEGPGKKTVAVLHLTANTVFEPWRSNKKRNPAASTKNIFCLCDPSQSGPPLLYNFNYLPPFIF